MQTVQRFLNSYNILQHQSVDLDMVIFYTDAVKTLGQLLPSGMGMNALNRLADTCAKIMRTPCTILPLQQVAAISLMSSIVQVCIMFKVSCVILKDGMSQAKLYL